jgi:hypothetical protein
LRCALATCAHSLCARDSDGTMLGCYVARDLNCARCKLFCGDERVMFQQLEPI